MARNFLSLLQGGGGGTGDGTQGKVLYLSLSPPLRGFIVASQLFDTTVQHLRPEC